jgi:hypothetical protein
MSDRPTPNDLRAKVFEDREVPANWRVEKMDEDGGYEVVKVFTGPDARDQAIRYGISLRIGSVRSCTYDRPYAPIQPIGQFGGRFP